MAAALLLVVWVFPGGATAEVPSLRLTTEEYPPFNFTDPATGKILGMSTDLVREMLERAGPLSYTIEMLPWQRAYREALEKPATCVFSTTETEQRMPLFKWVGPLVSNDWVFLAGPDTPITLRSLEDARPFVIGGYQGDATALFLQERGFNVLTAPADDHNVKLLAADRIDLWATGSQLGPWLARRQGVTDLEELYRFRTMQLSLACHPATADSVITRLQETLDAMEADGMADAIRARYH